MFIFAYFDNWQKSRGFEGNATVAGVAGKTNLKSTIYVD